MPAEPSGLRVSDPASGKARVVYPEDVEQLSFPWGRIIMLLSEQSPCSRAFSFGVVESTPGGSHELHAHDREEEIIYVVEGDAQLLSQDQSPRPLRQGALVHLPPGVAHATVNVGTGILRLIIVYAPAGPERALASLPGCTILPAGAAAPVSCRHPGIPVLPSPPRSH